MAKINSDPVLIQSPGIAIQLKKKQVLMIIFREEIRFGGWLSKAIGF
jgi:hypothetical protein